MIDVNQLLHDWATRNEPATIESERLQNRIVAQLANIERTAMSGQSGVRGRSTTTSAIALVAVAASLLAAVTVFWSGRRDGSERSVDLASLPASDLAARQSLFNELDRMFDGRWRWLSEVNGRVHLETDESSASPSDLPSEESSGVAMRLTIVQRRPGEAKWNVVWEASVLARSEEWVRLPVELPGDNSVSLWAYSLPDGSVLVESDVTLTVPVAVRVSDQQVFGSSRRPARLWSVRRSDGEFQLIQSIARWETHHG